MPQIERPDGLVVRFKSQTPPQPDLFFWAQVPLAQIGPAVAGLERALASTPAAAGPSTARSDPEPASTSAAQSSRIGASALAAALSSLQQARRPAPGPSLLAVLQPERLLPLLARNPALVEAVAPHLPEQHRGAEAIAHLNAHQPAANPTGSAARSNSRRQVPEPTRPGRLGKASSVASPRAIR